MTRLAPRILGMTLLALVGLATTAMAQTSPSRPAPQQPTSPPRETTPTPEPTQPQVEEDTEEQCPAFMRGSTLKVTDAKGGVAVSITTPVNDYVEPLRDTLKEVADAVEQESRMQAVIDETGKSVPPLEVSTKDIRNGGQMVIRTTKKDQVAELREQARGLEQAWANSSCVSGGEQAASR